LDIEYKVKDTIRKVENAECAAAGCNKLATKSIFFRLGFSARFCEVCSEDLLSKKIGETRD